MEDLIGYFIAFVIILVLYGVALTIYVKHETSLLMQELNGYAKKLNK